MKEQSIEQVLWSTILVFILLLLESCTQNIKHPYQILAIGDSNGAAKEGWVNQLKELVPADSIYNVSISGNTIGFDNLDQPRLNTLINLEKYLELGKTNTGYLDYVIILLGTNDSKAVFDGRQREIVQNMNRLVTRIVQSQKKELQVILVSPPPYGPDTVLAEKYKGGNRRVKSLTTQFQEISKENGLVFVNVYQLFEEDFMKYSEDGIHLNGLGQKMIAEEIKKVIH